MKTMKLILIVGLMSVICPVSAKTYSLVSPDGNIEVSISAGDRLTYSLSVGKDVVIQRALERH